ncbi:uncharacterized protein [Nothobranchius furzeri]|uniref:uncharacterized protein n=1 Tax=Nothobranchius furzeri TaxID=105023 RepID=UPI003904E0DE
MRGAGVDKHLTAWTIKSLTNRPLYVRLHNSTSEVVVCSTGAPQGLVFSLFLLTFYTSDFTYNTSSRHLQKYSDDLALVGCVFEVNDLEYRSVIMDFVDWCERNHLLLNTNETKEMEIDFQRNTPPHSPVNIQGEDIEVVDTFKAAFRSFLLSEMMYDLSEIRKSDYLIMYCDVRSKSLQVGVSGEQEQQPAAAHLQSSSRVYLRS